MLASATYTPTAPTAVMRDRRSEVEQTVRQRLSDCSYRYYFRHVEWEYSDGTLVLRGRVPTFYMKQILQTILRGIDHVDELSNEVDVVSATGLSSVG